MPETPAIVLLQRSQTGCVGDQKCEIILKRALSADRYSVAVELVTDLL